MNNSLGPVTLENSTLSQSTNGNCGSGGSITSPGNNLSDDLSCVLSSPGDLENTPALLGPLADNGGPTETELPLGPGVASLLTVGHRRMRA